jgi:SAM-dependent methyltransferase
MSKTHHTLGADDIASEPANILHMGEIKGTNTSGTANSIARRLRDPNFVSKYFVGWGVDIGSGHDPLDNYSDFFPGILYCMHWDKEDGDAQYMLGCPDNYYNFVHSSHCLEHVINPYETIDNWWRILKPGGHLVVLVPDEDMYEQGMWPSRFNGDHKHTFSTYKQESWSPVSISVFKLLIRLRDADIIKVERLTATWRETDKPIDQSTTPFGEPSIEFIVRKVK